MAEDTNNLQENEVQEGKGEVETPVETEEKEETPKKDPIGNRVKNLADKAKIAEEEKNQALAEKEELERERDFYQSFSEAVSIYPEAKDYQQEIKEKVMSGYTVEDATISMLAKEGKLGGQTVETPSHTIGGSASTPPTNSENKSVSEMSLNEKREALIEAEARGDLSLS